MLQQIPREFIDLLLTKIDLVELIKTEVPLTKKSNQNYFAKCPFHQEKSASFSVSQTKQFYYCFGCGAHGNAIDFLIHFERLTFRESIEQLARQVGMELPLKNGATFTDASLQYYDLMSKVSQFYYNQMRDSQKAVQYLKKRGISGPIAKQFILGYASNLWSQLLDHFGKKPEIKTQLMTLGLILSKDETKFYDRFRDRILFPIRDVRGRVIGFGGRVLDKGEPKYLNSPDTILFHKGQALYGLYETLSCHRKINRLLVVEGYMDVIALFQHGINYAVATMGTATTENHLRTIKRYTTDVIFCFDGDKAGNLAAWRALLTLLPLMQDDLEIRFLFLPEGEDPDSLIRKEGLNPFEKRIDQSLSLATFFYQKLSKESHLNSIEGRSKFAVQALNHIKTIPQSLFQEMMLLELSEHAKIGLAEIKAQLSHDPASKKAVYEEKKIATTSLKLTPFRTILSLLIQNPSFIHLIEKPYHLSDTPGDIFLKRLIEIIKSSPNITTGGLIEHWRDQKEKDIALKLAHWQHLLTETGLENEFKGAWRQWQGQIFDNKINCLLKKGDLTATEKSKLQQWIMQKKELNNIKN